MWRRATSERDPARGKSLRLTARGQRSRSPQWPWPSPSLGAILLGGAVGVSFLRDALSDDQTVLPLPIGRMTGAIRVVISRHRTANVAPPHDISALMFEYAKP
jgi:hypothetical protein